MMKMQPRFSFSVDSLLGRKTNEVDIKSECLGGFTDLTDRDQDHRQPGYKYKNISNYLKNILDLGILIKMFTINVDKLNIL